MFSRSFMLSVFVHQLSETFEELMNLLWFQFTMLNMFYPFTLIQFVRLLTVSRLHWNLIKLLHSKWRTFITLGIVTEVVWFLSVTLSYFTFFISSSFTVCRLATYELWLFLKDFLVFFFVLRQLYSKSISKLILRSYTYKHNNRSFKKVYFNDDLNKNL